LYVKKQGTISCADRRTQCAGVNSSTFCEPATCELTFSFAAGIVFDPDTLLQAGTVNLTTSGRLYIADKATITTEGMGLCGRDSLSQEHPFYGRSGHGQSGAGHGGFGGSCYNAEWPQGKKGKAMLSGTPYGIATAPVVFNHGAWGPKTTRPYFAELYGAGTSHPLRPLNQNHSRNMCTA
jgi:hypothetical protein